MTSSIDAEAAVALHDTFIKAGSSELEVISQNYSWRHRSPCPDSGNCGCYSVAHHASGLDNSLWLTGQAAIDFFFLLLQGINNTKLSTAPTSYNSKSAWQNFV